MLARQFDSVWVFLIPLVLFSKDLLEPLCLFFRNRLIHRRWTVAYEDFVLDLKSGKLAKTPQFLPLHAEQIETAPQVASALPGGVRLHLKKSKHLLKPIPRLEGVVVFASGKAYVVNVPVSQSGKGSHTQ